jgi:3-oxoadipate enol-lactonase
MKNPRRMKTTGLTVNIRIEGSGPPLLFLGGSNFDLSLKALVFDSELPNYFTVAACDPRGLGLTDSPSGAWTMLDYAQDALHVLDALDWEKADILGESFGAMVALHLAILAPQRIRRLALAAGSPGGAGGSSFPIEKFLEVADPLERARSSLSILDSRFDALLRDAPEEADLHIHARTASDTAFFSSHNNRNGYPRLLRTRATHDCWEQLPEITAPTLIFAGSYDQQAPQANAENMAQSIPHASLEIVNGGHGHCFGSPTPVATIVKHWTTEK